ncbi:hypothetical protein CDAR_59951 [Caerostris darwini]|uniref:Ycf15 n=1 Tax=Caerostris darwini TaxID=1538125 RepID=A0AAV4RS48_9ARAC|nr:hypothetical protein CDAR_59941 [Caerostris darwini]GIY23267.1 hypothetical protein CDAR_59951 [Caerostris darwini]
MQKDKSVDQYRNKRNFSTIFRGSLEKWFQKSDRRDARKVGFCPINCICIWKGLVYLPGQAGLLALSPKSSTWLSKNLWQHLALEVALGPSS